MALSLQLWRFVQVAFNCYWVKCYDEYPTYSQYKSPAFSNLQKTEKRALSSPAKLLPPNNRYVNSYMTSGELGLSPEPLSMTQSFLRSWVCVWERECVCVESVRRRPLKTPSQGCLMETKNLHSEKLVRELAWNYGEHLIGESVNYLKHNI